MLWIGIGIIIALVMIWTELNRMNGVYKDGWLSTRWYQKEANRRILDLELELDILKQEEDLEL